MVLLQMLIFDPGEDDSGIDHGVDHWVNHVVDHGVNHGVNHWVTWSKRLPRKKKEDREGIANLLV